MLSLPVIYQFFVGEIDTCWIVYFFQLMYIDMVFLYSTYRGSNQCSFGDTVFRFHLPYMAATTIILSKWYHQWLHYTTYCTARWKQSCLQSTRGCIITSLWRCVHITGVWIFKKKTSCFHMNCRLTGICWVWSCCCCSDCSWNWPLLKRYKFHNSRRW